MLSPQPATAPALPVGALQYPSVPCVQVASFSTRVSVWRPAGRGSTPRTTLATVRAYMSCFPSMHFSNNKKNPAAFILHF